MTNSLLTMILIMMVATSPVIAASDYLVKSKGSPHCRQWLKKSPSTLLWSTSTYDYWRIPAPIPIKSQLRSHGCVTYFYADQKIATAPEEFSTFSSNQDHLAILQVARAWELEQGSDDLLIAVTDNGFDLDHADLRPTFAINVGEWGTDSQGQDKSENGIDDDGNGFIDDFQGWDFVEDDNDPRPSFFGEASFYHGTHISGIIGADPANSIGTAGIAPGVRVLPLRFASNSFWRVSDLAEAYLYALERGARIISTSFAIDAYANAPIYRDLIRYLADQGVIVFNSAGNSGKVNPTRQINPDVIFVGQTWGETGKKNIVHPNSNRGVGIDLYAPGNIYSTLPGDNYGYRSGTSMATPVAAAVAGLVWSYHPNWSREQVITQLFGSAEGIAAFNPSLERYVGFGRVNANRALTAAIADPTLSLLNPIVSTQRQNLTLLIHQPFDPDLPIGNFFTVVDTEGKPFTLSLSEDYRIASNFIALDLPALAEGKYTLLVSPQLTNAFGQSITNRSFSFEVRSPHHAEPRSTAARVMDSDLRSQELLRVNMSFDLNDQFLTFISVAVENIDTGESRRLTEPFPQKTSATIEFSRTETLSNGSYEVKGLIISDDYGNSYSLDTPKPLYFSKNW